MDQDLINNMEYIQPSGYVETRDDSSISITEAGLVTLFEKRIGKYLGMRFSAMCNSGSSANLLAISSLEFEPGSEIIVPACSFPTTVAPIIQNGLIPVFVDVDETYNLDPSQLSKAISTKTVAVMAAHTLGNPFNINEIMLFCKENDLYLLEDACDALGSEYQGRMVGSFGYLSTLSFYPAHQITTGEGGMVLTNSVRTIKAVRSLRDWGRDCWCAPGVDNTCGNRFSGEYDHKYAYSRIGYNLKSTDYHAQIGLSQLDRIGEFTQKRRENWAFLWNNIMCSQEKTEFSEPSWFGFAMERKDRNDFARYLHLHKIGSRPLFGGNLLRQPGYKRINCRVIGDLPHSNQIYEHSLWVGCWQGITQDQLNYMVEVINDY